MSSCNTVRTDSRIMATPSPVRNASRSSDRADWDKAIGGSPSVRDLVVSHRRSRRWPPTSRHHAGPQSPPLHGTLLSAAVAPLVWVVVVAVAREGGKQAVRKVV